MSMNTANTETNTTAANAKRTRKPRAKKPAAVKTTETAQEAPKAPTAGHSNTAAMTAAALGLAVFFTCPPAWKLAQADKTPYWQVEVKDTQGKRYSDVYRIKDQARAEKLAQMMAADRKIPLKVIPTAGKASAPAPVEEPNDASDDEPTPF